MKTITLLVVGFCSGLSATLALASENSDTPVDSAEEAAVEQNAGDGIEPTAGGAERGATVGKAKPADTGTAASYIYDQVKKGNIKIEVSTDTAAPP